jgi:hypothetical protein
MEKGTTETTEIAIKFGVATPETSEELQWEEETFFRWFHPTKGVFFLCTSTSYINSDGQKRYVLSDVKNGNQISNTTFVYGTPAPQMHEIAKHLPVFIMNDTGKKYIAGEKIGQPIIYRNFLCYGFNGNQIAELYYSTQYDEEEYSVEIGNHHYAEAYAQMFIKLREAGLLEKEVQK